MTVFFILVTSAHGTVPPLECNKYLLKVLNQNLAYIQLNHLKLPFLGQNCPILAITYVQPNRLPVWEKKGDLTIEMHYQIVNKCIFINNYNRI